MEHKPHEAQILRYGSPKDTFAERRLSAEIDDLHQMHALSLRLASATGLNDVLVDAMATAAGLMDSSLGTAQLITADGRLAMVGELGFGEVIKDKFPVVSLGDCSVCAAALKSKTRVAVRDLGADPSFGEIAAALRFYGAASGVSSPVLDRSGNVLAMFSIYWLEPHELSERENRVLDLCAELAGRHIERAAADEAIRSAEASFRSRQSLLMRELAHRGKNLVTVIQAIAVRTLSGDRTLNEARDIFVGRLTALAATYNTLTEESPVSAPVHDIVAACLSSHLERADIEGPTVEIAAKAAQTLALVLHELATNAAKYGALSTSSGRIEVRWGRSGSAGDHFYLEWIERGGPPVAPPTSKGFGSRIVTSVIGTELHCAPTITYDVSGLRYRLECPFAVLQEANN